jgi:hypothetical protein
MLSESDLSIMHEGNAHTVIALGRYGKDVRSLPVEEVVVKSEGRVAFVADDWLEEEVDDNERTWSFRGVLGLDPPTATDAAANMVAASFDHLSYRTCVAASGFALVDCGSPPPGGNALD